MVANKTDKRRSLFKPFRALGYVTSDTPMSVQALGQAYFITSSIGDSFQIFDHLLPSQPLIFTTTGPKLESHIASIASFKEYTYAAVDSQIIAFERSKERFRLSSSAATTGDEEGPAASISTILVLGTMLFALCLDNTLKMWDVFERSFVGEIEFGIRFTATVLLHPSTYLNKILVGSQQGGMQLWNVRSSKLIYEFKSFGSPITALAQSPSIDVVVIGLLDGTIILHNIKVDKEIMRFKQDGKVTAATFRTDGQPIMATSNMFGDIALWDLDERRLVHIMKGAHDAAIHTCMFFNGKPILLTAAADNSIKQWMFDTLEGVPRLLKIRSGHHKPPTHIRYYDNEGKTIISSGMDQALRSFSVIRDAQNVEFSQGSLLKKSKRFQVHIDALKFPVITDFSASCVREWDNVVTCHANQTVARTWNFERKALGKHVLPSQDGSTIKAVAISACGNFGFIGTTKGRIDKFNLQSGLHRLAYTGEDIGHTKAITAIAPDNINRILISASIDKTIK
eukprot:jgi/Hompol1/2600/HPOL_006068-RA